MLTLNVTPIQLERIISKLSAKGTEYNYAIVSALTILNQKPDRSFSEYDLSELIQKMNGEQMVRLFDIIVY